PRDPHRIDLLARGESVGGARPQRSDDVGELMVDEVATNHLVIEVPLLEHLVIEEMTKRTVPDVVQQSRDPERLLDQRRRRRIGERGTERTVDAPSEETREMHRTQEMGESRMFSAGKYPPR